MKTTEISTNNARKNTVGTTKDLNISITFIGNPAIPKGQRRCLKTLLPNLRNFRPFKLSNHVTAILDKRFPPATISVIENYLRLNAFHLSQIKGLSHLCISTQQYKPEQLSQIKDSCRCLYLPAETNTLEIPGYLQGQLFPSTGEYPASTPSAIIELTHPDFDLIKHEKTRIMTAIQKVFDPYVTVTNNVFNRPGQHDQQILDNAIRLLPTSFWDNLSPDCQAALANNLAEFVLTGKESILVNHAKAPMGIKRADTYEILVVKTDYFGFAHDLVSALRISELEPININFSLVGGHTNGIIGHCLVKACSISHNKTKVHQSISDLLKEDEARRRELPLGERLYFSFINLYHSAAKLCRSLDPGIDMQEFIASLQGHPEIMIEILRQLRSEADPLFYPEKIMDCKTTEEITRLINDLPPEASQDKAALRFFLKFVAAVKKTDYFDLNRLSELFSFTLETSPLLPFLANQNERTYFPSEIIYNFKVNGEMFFVPITAAEKRLSGNRFSDNRCLTAFPAPALPSLLRSQAQVYDDTFLALANSILPPKQRDHLQKLLYRIGYIDEQGRRYNTQFLGGNKYFNLCTRAIFSPVTDDGQPHNEPNYLFDVASKMGVVPQHMDRVEIRFVDQGAIKDVSRVVVYAPDKIKRSFAVAIEKNENAGEKSDPVKDEYELFNMMRKKTPLVPSPFGFTTLPINPYKNASILFREFLFGIDGLKYLGRIKKDWIIDSFFYQVGLAMSTLFAETGMGTSDFKLKNLIFDYERRNLRFCDVLPISDDFDDIVDGFKNEVDEIEDFAPRSLPYFFAGILGNREKGKEFLTRARNYLYYSDTNDACFSVPIRRSIDEYIIKQGYRPNSFFRLE